MENETKKITKIEVAVIAVCLGVIAAIIIPQYSLASTNARTTELISALQTIRSQIELYKIQHNDLFPGQLYPGDSIRRKDFTEALTNRDAEGLGPYLLKIPKNPFNAKNSITFVNDKQAVPAGTEETGWWLNIATGEFRACDSPENTLL